MRTIYNMVELKGLMVGSIHETNNSGKIEILEVVNSRKVLIRFVDTGFEKFADSRLIRKGVVKDNTLSYQSCGAILDVAGKTEGVASKAYKLWNSMMGRCYSTSMHEKRPRYSVCEVSEYFKRFSNFEGWCDKQTSFGAEGFDLDKDLLFKGNKVYSEHTCCFLPQEINKSLQKTNKLRGDLPIGVCFDKSRGKYRAAIKMYGKHINLGRFECKFEAFQAYKVAKEGYLKELAEKWKDAIDLRAYDALMNYEVDIDD